MTYLLLLSRYFLYFPISAPYVLFLIGIGLSGHRVTLELQTSTKWVAPCQSASVGLRFLLWPLDQGLLIHIHPHPVSVSQGL